MTATRFDAEPKQNLTTAYQDFAEEREPGRKDEAGRELIRVIFGADSIAEESVS